MSSVRKLFKFLGFLAVMVGFFSHSLVATLLIRHLRDRRIYFVKITSRWAELICWILGVKADYQGYQKANEGKGHLVVCNHLSYTDLFVIIAKVPGIFVTSNEIRETPVLGYIARRSGCIFVERRKSRRTPEGREKELRDIAEVVGSSLNVILFPEATSTNGAEVIPFKSGMFQASVEHNLPIKPLTLNYLGVDRESNISEKRDHVFWYGDMRFLPHLMNLFGHKEVAVKLSIGEPFLPETGASKYDVAEVAHQEVSKNYLNV